MPRIGVGMLCSGKIGDLPDVCFKDRINIVDGGIIIINVPLKYIRDKIYKQFHNKVTSLAINY